MSRLQRTRKATAAAILGLIFFLPAAQAAEVNFDSALNGASFHDAGYSAGGSAGLLAAPSAPAPVAGGGARVYDFKTLYKGLGYPSPTFFGSSETELMDLDSYTSKQDAFYSEINGYLRFYPAPYDWYGTGPEDAKLIVANIDRIFTRAPALPSDLVLFRGLDLKFRASHASRRGSFLLI